MLWRDGDTGELTLRSTLTLKFVDANVDPFDDGIFFVEFPPGTRVRAGG